MLEEAPSPPSSDLSSLSFFIFVNIPVKDYEDSLINYFRLLHIKQYILLVKQNKIKNRKRHYRNI